MSGNFEGKKHAYRQTQDGIVVSFVVHPSDISSAIAMAPLGTRFMVAFAEIGGDEKPIENNENSRGGAPTTVDAVPRPQANEAGISKPKKRFEELPLSQQCAMRCEDEAFREFMVDRSGILDEDVPTRVRGHCGVSSRAELNNNPGAAKKWGELERDYQNWLTSQRYADTRR